MFNIRKSLIALLITGALLVSTSGMAFAAKVYFATTLPEADNPETRAMKVFKTYVEFHTAREIQVQLLHGGVGGDREILESIRNNVFQITATTGGAFASFYPKVQVFSIPYLFRSARTAIYFMRNSDVMANMVENMAKQTGIRVVDYAADGFRNFVNNAHPIKTPADLKGLKMRSMESPVMIRLMKSFGAAPTPIPFPESAMAIRSGVVDGGENPPSTIINGGWGEVIKYMSMDEHIFSPVFVATNDSWINGLSPKNRGIILEGLDLYSAIMIAGKGEGYLADTKRIENMGVKVYVNTPSEKKAFRDVAQKPVLIFLREKLGKKFVNDFVESVQKTEASLYK